MMKYMQGPVYVEDSLGWWIAGWLFTIGVLVVLAVLAVFMLAAVALGRWVEGRFAARARRRVQSKPILR